MDSEAQKQNEQREGISGNGGMDDKSYLQNDPVRTLASLAAIKENVPRPH